MAKSYPHLCLFFIFLGMVIQTTESFAAPIIRDVYTFSECEKMASIRVRNGVAPYTYVWKYGGNIIQTDANIGENDFSTIEQAQAGDYTLEVTDSAGNTYTEIITFSGSTNFILNIIYDENQECEGETFGNVYGTIENGIAPFTINFYDESSSMVLTTVINGRNIDLNGVPAGKYVVEVIDATGCKELTEVEIEEIESLVMVPGEGAGSFPETCVANGGVIFDATGYVGEVAFRIRRANGTYETGWLAAPAGEIRYDQLSAGDYVLEIIDQFRLEDCPEEVVFSIGNEILLEVIPSATPVSCFGETDGSVTLEVNRLFMEFPFPPTQVEVDIIRPDGSMALSGETVHLGATSGEATFLGFGPGVHTMVIRHGGEDYPECTLTYQVTVNSPSSPLTASVTSTPETCFGGNDGTASVNRSNGWGEYTYLWSDGQTSRTATNLAPGDYTVTVTDTGGCSIQLEVTIAGPDGPIAGEVEVLKTLICVGADDGSARVYGLSGGWSSYSYLWDNGETTPTAYNLPAGLSTVIVRDAEGCEEEFTVDIPVPDAPEISYTVVDPSCFGGADGSIRVQIADEVTSFSVKVNGVTETGNDLTFTGLSAGQVEIQISYGGNCTIVDFVDIQNPPQININEVNLTINPILCAGDGNGSITGISVSGGTGTLLYQWQKQVLGVFESLDDQTSLSISNLSGGEYRLLVTDQNGCEVQKNYTLNEPAPLAAGPPSVVDISCFGESNGSVSFSLSGGTLPYSYALNRGGFINTSNTDITISGLAAGMDYFIEIRDANGCVVPNLNFDIETLPPLAISSPTVTPEACFGQGNGSIEIEITGGTGNWGVEWYEAGNFSTIISTDQNLTNGGPGQYTVKVFDLDNPSCHVQEIITIPTTPELSLELDGSPVNIFCFGESTGAIDIEVGGGTGDYTFEWMGPDGFLSSDQNIEGLTAGLYHVRVTDENGCWKELKDILVSQPSGGMAISVLNKVTPKCHDSLDGRIEIQVGGGNPAYSIEWQREDAPGVFLPVPGSSLTLSNIVADTYKVIVTDANLCSTEAIIELDAPDPLQVSLADKLNVSCFGRNDGKIILEVTGGTGVYFFNWDHGFINQNPANLGAGVYGVTVTDANGCSFKFENIEITQPDQLGISLVDITAPSCGLDDAAIEVEFLGAYPSEAFSRWVSLSTDEVIAENQSSVSGLSPGFYRVEYGMGESCVVSKTFNIPGPANPLRLVTSSQDVSCPGETGIIFFSATGGVPSYSYYILEDGIWQEVSNTILAGLEAGSYEVRVEDASGCQDHSTITVDQPNPPVFDAGVERHVSCFGGDDGAILFSVTGGTGEYQVQWFSRTSTGGKLPIAESDLGSLIAGTYFMEVTYAGGCMVVSPEYTITQPEQIIINETLVQSECAEDMGSFTLEVAGGSPGKSIFVSSPNGYSNTYENEHTGTFLFEDLDPGEYIWTLEDPGCPVLTGSFTILTITMPQFDFSFQNVSCFGANDGIIQITDPLIHGDRTFTVWINGVNQGNQKDFLNIPAGIYHIRIQDNLGCQSDPVSVEIIQPDRPLEITNLMATDVTCFEENTGSINFEISGGRPGYRAVLTCSWGCPQELTQLSEEISYTFAALEAGQYTLEVWDQNDVCQASEDITISQPELLSASLEVGEISCLGGSTFLELTVTGGIQPYSYQWEKYNEGTEIWGLLPESSHRLNDAEAGRYRYTVQEENGCSVLSERVDIPDGMPVELSFEADEILCYGESAGVTLEATSGTSTNFTYFVNGSQIFGNEFLAKAGSYVVYAVNNSKGCVSEELFIDMEQAAEPLSVKDYASVNLSCFESGDGSISLTLTGGTAPYTVNFLGNTYTAEEDEELVFQDLSANISYAVTGEDAKGCLINVPPTILSQPLPLQASVAFAPIVCFEGSTDINLQITGGTKPYTVTWTYSEDGIDFEPFLGSDDETSLYGTQAGFYTYTVSDGGCADIVQTVEVDQPQAILLEADPGDVFCYGGNDGTVAFSPSGGAAANYRIFFNGLEISGNTVTGLTAGTYTAYAMNGACRSENMDITISQPLAPLSASVDYMEEVFCHDDLSDIQVQISGGTGPYKVYLNGQEKAVPESGSITFEDLNPEAYSIRVVDAGGCEWAQDLTIGNPEPMEIFTEEIINISCYEGSDGEIKVSLTGGTGAYSFDWIDVSGQTVGSNKNLVGVTAGKYTLTVRDENNCEASKEFEVTEPSPVDFSFTSTDVSCFDGQNGRIEVTGSGGFPAYALMVDGIQYPTLSATGLTAKTYIVYVIDALGCASPAQEIIIGQPLPLILDIEASDVTCYTANNGQAGIQIEGGTAPYKVRWSDGNLTPDRVGMAPGNYEVVVTDTNGCTIRENVVISQPDPITINSEVTDVNCYDGKDGGISLEISGGNGNYTVEWEAVDSGEEVGEGEIILNLHAGTYRATITDQEGCEVKKEYVVSQPNTTTIQPLVTDVRCAGEASGSIDLIVTGGTAPYTYSWSTGETGRSIQNKSGGIYLVEVTDARGCTIAETIEILEPEPLIVEETITDLSCKFGSEGSIRLDISGGSGSYQVQWSNGRTGTEVIGLRAGTYTVFVLDERSCFESFTYVIEEPEEALSITANGSFERCMFDEVMELELAVTGGTAPYSFTWSNGANTKDLYDITPGDYTVQVTDAKGCTLEETFKIPAVSSPMDIQLDGKLGICSNDERGQISTSISGGEAPFTYLWSNGATTSNITDLGPGIYTVEVTDATGCWVSETVEITRPRDLNVTLEAIKGVSCFGGRNGSIQIGIHSEGAPYKVTWSHGVEDQLSVSNLAAGTYTVQVEDASGCVTTVAYQVREPESLIFFQTLEDITCHGDNNGAISLDVRGGTAPYAYQWSNGATSRRITNLSPGTYSVIITDRMGCSTGGEFTVAEPDPLKVDVSYSELLACHGDQDGFVQLNITGGVQPYTIHWEDQPAVRTQNRNGLAAGNYSVAVVDDNGCSEAVTVEIEEPEKLEASLFTRFDVDCESKELMGVAWIEITSGAEGEFQIIWNNGDRDVEETSFFENGLVSVRITNENGCMVELSETVEMPLAFTDAEFTYTVISTGIQGEILVNDPVRFNDETKGNVIAWKWDLGDGTHSTEQHPIHTYHRPGTYTISLTTYDILGCVSQTSLTVEVVSSYRILVPNAFSPNDDGLNDTFLPKVRGLDEFEMHIFNKWGELVYSIFSLEDPGWDGRLRGKISPNGNYVYKVKFKSVDGERGSKTGVFTLVL